MFSFLVSQEDHPESLSVTSKKFTSVMHSSYKALENSWNLGHLASGLKQPGGNRNSIALEGEIFI